MRLALAQINSVVGDLDGNRDRILDRLAAARDAGADLVLFPELAVTGYPPEDLLLRPGFVRAVPAGGRGDRRRGAAGSWRSSARPTSTPISTTPATSSPTARSAASTASASCRTTASSTRTGTSRPATTCSCSASARRSSGRRSARTSGSRGRRRPTSRSRAPSSSRTSRRRRSTSARTASARRCCGCGRATTRASSRSATQSAAQDELIFDGHSVVLDDEGELIARAPGFEEALLVVDVDPAAAIGRRLRDVRRRALAATATAPRWRRCSSSIRRARRRSGCTPSPLRLSTTSSRCAARSSSGLRDYIGRTASATS